MSRAPSSTTTRSSTTATSSTSSWPTWSAGSAQVAQNGVAGGAVVVGDLDRAVGVAGVGDAGQRALVVAGLEVGELEGVGGRYDHHAIAAVDQLAGAQLLQGGQGDARVRTGEHARQ